MKKLNEKTLEIVTAIPGVSVVPDHTIYDNGIFEVDLVEESETVRQAVRDALTAYLPYITELKFRVGGPVRPLAKK